MLVTQLAQQLADTEQFEVVVGRSLRQAPPFVDFLTELICAIALDRTLPQPLDAIMRHLLIQLRSRRYLLILNNMETVFSSKNLVGTYRSGSKNCGLQPALQTNRFYYGGLTGHNINPWNHERSP
jgi:hypothetical protein